MTAATRLTGSAIGASLAVGTTLAAAEFPGTDPSGVALAVSATEKSSAAIA
jgi:hypothetical protein